MTGELVAIFLAPGPGEAMREVREARIEAGAGLVGDRYAAGRGTFSAKVGSGREVTLVEEEALLAAARDEGVEIAPILTRRNLLVRGVYLSHLVGRELDVGEVRLVGRRLCEPCRHLERLLGNAHVRRVLAHRGGLRCDVVRGGVVRAGDRMAAPR